MVIEQCDVLLVLVFFSALEWQSGAQREIVSSIPKVILDEGIVPSTPSMEGWAGLEEPILFSTKKPKEANEAKRIDD